MKVSIIIPAYNCEKTIARCIESVKAQTYTDWDCIIVDDESEDNTVQIISDMVGADSRFICFSNLHGGVSAARNFAMETAQASEAFFFLDADDWMTPNALEYLVEQAKLNPNVGRIVSPPIIHWQNYSTSLWDMRPRGFLRADDEHIFADSKCDVGHVTGCLYIRNRINYKMFFPDVAVCEDMLFNMELLFAGVPLLITERSVYHYTRSNESLSYGGLSLGDAAKMCNAFIDIAFRYSATLEQVTRFDHFLMNVIHAKLRGCISK